MSQMNLPIPVELFGAPASPYTRKMVALFRYRRIPYAIHWAEPGNALDARGIPRPKPLLLPVLLLPNDSKVLVATCDSSPIIRQLEAAVPERAVVPDNPVLAFLDALLEDFADEWGTRYMFHFRWHYRQDADNAAQILPLGQAINLPLEQHRAFGEAFRDRQVNRLYVVGSNPTTAASIEASYQRFLVHLNTILEQQPFLLGHRPASSDFAVYGQLSQLVGCDPTPRALAHNIAPRAVAWTDIVEDLSGLSPTSDDWLDTQNLRTTLQPLLTEIGRVYTPTMLANARAVVNGDVEWATTVDGQPWNQPTFPYQAKCLRWLREAYEALETKALEEVDDILADTGCEQLFA